MFYVYLSSKDLLKIDIFKKKNQSILLFHQGYSEVIWLFSLSVVGKYNSHQFKLRYQQQFCPSLPLHHECKCQHSEKSK